jgi:hypothetical protein
MSNLSPNHQTHRCLHPDEVGRGGVEVERRERGKELPSSLDI